MKQRTRDEHLFDPGPKRILALDGGGIRGALTLGYLKQIEGLLRKRVGGDPDFRLCDYFDLIGGTSTGSIIAAGLALGRSVDQLQTLYQSLAKTVFRRRSFLSLGLLDSKFPVRPLENALKKEIGPQTTLGSDALRTGLMVMTKRLDTGSPWPLHNNPKGRYYEGRAEGTGAANKDYFLWQIVRASTAAPHYFEPERVRVAASEGRAVYGAFVDGGVSTAGNPALQLFLLATLEGYGLQWPLGPDNLLLTSVGTGSQEMRLSTDELLEMPAAEMSLRALVSMMGDCDQLGQILLQWMGRTETPSIIDSEIGNLRNDNVDGRKLLSYLRYNAELNPAWLKAQLGMKLDERAAASLGAMDNLRNVLLLEEVGAKAAAVQIEEKHFPTGFDI